MGNTQVNDLIFRELIKRGYSLEGNTRVWNIADSKLWYLTPEQAQSYLDLLDSETYQTGYAPKESQMINEHLETLMSRVGNGPYNVVDLGCGDGRKAIKFIEELLKQSKVRYYPIDISGYMVKKAIHTISTMEVEEVVESQWNISDFENLENVTSLINNSNYPRSVFLLLGNTLSNFEFHDLLYQVRSSMKTGDCLIIGNGIENETVEEDMKKFTEKNVHFNEFLVRVPLQLGMKRENIQLNARFRNHRIEFYYDIKENHTVLFGEKKLEFNKGDQIIVAVSYHYSKNDFTSFLNLYFDEVSTKYSKDGSYALAFCRK